MIILYNFCPSKLKWKKLGWKFYLLYMKVYWVVTKTYLWAWATTKILSQAGRLSKTRLLGPSCALLNIFFLLSRLYVLCVLPTKLTKSESKRNRYLLNFEGLPLTDIQTLFYWETNILIHIHHLYRNWTTTKKVIWYVSRFERLWLVCCSSKYNNPVQYTCTHLLCLLKIWNPLTVQDLLAGCWAGCRGCRLCTTWQAASPYSRPPVSYSTEIMSW